jgi:hypothetical protein
MEYINTSSHPARGIPQGRIPLNDHNKKANLLGAREIDSAPNSQEISQDDAWTVIKAYFK